jgi:hypothetical protein
MYASERLDLNAIRLFIGPNRDGAYPFARHAAPELSGRAKRDVYLDRFRIRRHIRNHGTTGRRVKETRFFRILSHLALHADSFLSALAFLAFSRRSSGQLFGPRQRSCTISFDLQIVFLGVLSQSSGLNNASCTLQGITLPGVPVRATIPSQNYICHVSHEGTTRHGSSLREFRPQSDQDLHETLKNTGVTHWLHDCHNATTRW